MSSVVSVNVGLPRDVEWQGKLVHTGIWKKPVAGRVMARRLNLALSLDDFGAASESVPVVCNLMPAGAYLMEDFHFAGGLRGLMSVIKDYLDLEALTCGQARHAANGTAAADGLCGDGPRDGLRGHRFLLSDDEPRASVLAEWPYHLICECPQPG